MNEKERLRHYANARWGDEWTMRIYEWTDGDEHAEAFHTADRVAPGHVIRKVARVHPKSDELFVSTVLHTTDLPIPDGFEDLK